MIKYQLVIGLAMLAVTSYGQKVIVNPDGTHSIQTGSVIVNPNGTHSTVHGSGTNSVIVNPNGTHSVRVGSVIVNPNGSHTVVQDSTAIDAYRAWAWPFERNRKNKTEKRPQ